MLFHVKTTVCLKYFSQDCSFTFLYTQQTIDNLLHNFPLKSLCQKCLTSEKHFTQNFLFFRHGLVVKKRVKMPREWGWFQKFIVKFLWIFVNSRFSQLLLSIKILEIFPILTMKLITFVDVFIINQCTTNKIFGYLSSNKGLSMSTCHLLNLSKKWELHQPILDKKESFLTE